MFRRDQFFDLNLTAEDILRSPIHFTQNAYSSTSIENSKPLLNEDGSDFAADNTTTGFIVVSGDSVSGQISSGTDVDWIFLDNPDVASVLNLSFTTDSALGMEINLIGIDGLGQGNEVYNFNVDTDIAGDVNFELPDTDVDIVWFFELVATEDFAHDYTLTVTQAGTGSDDFAGDASTAGFLQPGVSTSTGILEFRDDHDWFSFTATEGQVIDFAVLRPGTLATDYELTFVIRDANGDIVPVFDYIPFSLYNEITFIAESTGTYYLDVSASAGWSDQTATSVADYGHYEIFPILSGLSSSLAPAFQVGYVPWTALPDIVDRPTVPARTDGAIFPEEDFTIGVDEVYFWGLESNDAAITGLSSGVNVDVTQLNQGLIYVEDLYGFVENDNFPIADNSWAYAVVGGNNELFRNEGQVVAISSLYSAAGFFDFTGATTFENLGSIQAVSAYGDALGASTLDNFTAHFNSGTIEAWAGNIATGISLDNGGSFDNSGLIRADGFNDAQGVILDNFSSDFVNSGTVIATTSGSNSVGIFAFASDGAGGSNTYQITIDNSGTINADAAIVVFQDEPSDLIGPNEEFTRVTNTGTIIGDIFLDAGNDRIDNSNVIDGNIFMGGGIDEYLGQNGTVSGLIDLGSGDDIAIGSTGSEIFIGGLGNDTLTGGGGGGGDTFVFGNEDGMDIITDFDANDILSLDLRSSTSLSDVQALMTNFSNYVLLTLSSGNTIRINGRQSDDFTINNFEFIGTGNVITGDDSSNNLDGTSDDDIIEGLRGNDTLNGLNGDDTLIGGGGRDVLDGGEGYDIASYEGSTNRVIINMATRDNSSGHATGDTFVSIEGVTGSRFGDEITGNRGDNVISGGDGFDTLSGFIGDDTILGGAGNDFMTGGAGADIIDGGEGISDVVRYVGSNAGVTIDLGAGTASGGHAEGDTILNTEFVFGSSHDDSITGDAANNWLFGDGGNDTLSGGAGIDKFFGGAGSDTFTFAAGDQFVFVTDFQNDIDTIDLSAYGFADLSEALGNMNQLGAHVRFFVDGETLYILNTTLDAVTDDIMI